MHLSKGSGEVIGQSGKMVQTTLHDQNVFGFVAEREKPAIGHNAVCRTVILGDETRGEIDAREIREAE